VLCAMVGAPGEEVCKLPLPSSCDQTKLIPSGADSASTVVQLVKLMERWSPYTRSCFPLLIEGSETPSRFGIMYIYDKRVSAKIPPRLKDALAQRILVGLL
jgi:hypothetical protein